MQEWKAINARGAVKLIGVDGVTIYIAGLWLIVGKNIRPSMGKTQVQPTIILLDGLENMGAHWAEGTVV